MLGLTSKAYCVQKGPVKSLLLFLFHLAWKSRIRLPVLIAVGFMVLDLRMQLEINIDLGQGIPIVGQGNEQNGEILIDGSDSEETDVGEEDSDSVSTDPCSYDSSSSSEESDDQNNDQMNPNLDCSQIGLNAEDETRRTSQEDG